jgi:hypothetical protein
MMYRSCMFQIAQSCIPTRTQLEHIYLLACLDTALHYQVLLYDQIQANRGLTILYNLCWCTVLKAAG